MTNIASRLYDAHYAESELENQLEQAGAEFEGLGWDWYDHSIELHGVTPDYRLSEEAQKIIHKAGFSTAFVNHTDKWETHYHFNPNGKFKESKGWRVSYPHKRGEGEKGIWVEEVCQTWPKDWFDSGYCIVKSK